VNRLLKKHSVKALAFQKLTYTDFWTHSGDNFQQDYAKNGIKWKEK
jgi:hypothetical protein